MNKNNAVFIAICILILTLATIVSMAKCSDNKANVLWPEGRVITK